MAERVLGLGRWFDRVLMRRSPRVERALLIAAGVLFLAAAVIGFASLPEGTRLARWELLLIVALFGAPANLTLVSLEYLIGARGLGLRVSLTESIRISVMSSAANLLPLPGSVLVRTRGLRQAGSSYKRALGLLVAIGALWVGVSAIITGGLLLTDGWLLGAILVPIGVGLLAGGHVVVRLFADRSLALTGQIIAVEAGTTLVLTLRVYLTILALGIPISLPQATALQFAGVVATASGIFPGGLGLREVLSGAISPVVGLPASVGLVAATLIRVVDKVVLLPVAVVAVVRGRRRAGIPQAEAPEEPEAGGILARRPTEI